MTDTVVMVLGLCALVVFWDAWRRYVDAVRFNKRVLEQLDHFQKEHERVSTQLQNIAQKLNAQQASQATRMPRIAR